MFVLRSHEPDAASAARSPREDGPAATAAARAPADNAATAPVPDQRRAGEGPPPAPEGGAVHLTVVGADNPRGLPMHMPLCAAAFAVRFGGANAALECPKHLADVQGVIDRVGARMDAARGGMPREQAALVRALLEDARMLLAAARRNHERPDGPYDHARAIAKADAALGHARAAEFMQSRSATG